MPSTPAPHSERGVASLAAHQAYVGARLGALRPCRILGRASAPHWHPAWRADGCRLRSFPHRLGWLTQWPTSIPAGHARITLALDALSGQWCSVSQVRTSVLYEVLGEGPQGSLVETALCSRHAPWACLGVGGSTIDTVGPSTTRVEFVVRTDSRFDRCPITQRSLTCGAPACARARARARAPRARARAPMSGG